MIMNSFFKVYGFLFGRWRMNSNIIKTTYGTSFFVMIVSSKYKNALQKQALDFGQSHLKR